MEVLLTASQPQRSMPGLKRAVASLFVRGHRFTAMIAAISAVGWVGEPLMRRDAADAADFTA